MSKFNFAQRRSALQKAAAPAATLPAPTAQPLAPDPAMPPKARAMPAQPSQMGGFIPRSTRSRAAEEMENESLPEQAPVQPQQKVQNPVEQKMKQEMISWLRQQKPGVPSATPPKSAWFEDGETMGANPGFIARMQFTNLASKILTPTFGEGGTEQFISQRQQQHNQTALQPNDPNDEGDLSRRQWLKDTGLKGQDVLPRGAQDAEPHVQAFSENIADRFLNDPAVQEAVHRFGGGDENLATNALYSAVGASDKASGENNAVRFFLEGDNLKYLPAPILQHLNNMPEIASQLGNLNKRTPEAGRARTEISKMLSGPVLPVIKKRIEALSMLASEDLGKKADAARMDPGVASFDDAEVAEALVKRGLIELKRRISDKHMRSQYNGGPASLDDNQGGEGKALGTTIADPKSVKPKSSTEYEDAPQTADPHDLEAKDKENAVPQALPPIENPNDLDVVARRVSKDFKHLAQQVREAGKDISTYMSKMWQTDPSTPKAECVARAQRFRELTRYLAAAVDGISGSQDANRVELKKMLAKLSESPEQAAARKAKKAKPLAPGEAPKPAKPEFTAPTGKLIDNPQAVEQATQNPEAGELWDTYSDFNPNKANANGALSDDTQRLKAWDYFKSLVNDKEFVASIKQRAQKWSQSPRPAFQEYGKALDKATTLGSDSIWDRCRYDFPKWGPFMLLDPVRQKYDTITRRLLTDILPMVSYHQTGRSPEHGKIYPILYHAIRGELHNAPTNTGFGPKAPQGSRQWTPEQAIQQVQQWKSEAAKNPAIKQITERWNRMQQMKHQLVAMRTNMVMLKTASVDISAIDRMIARANAYLEEQSNLFFNIVRS